MNDAVNNTSSNNSNIILDKAFNSQHYLQVDQRDGHAVLELYTDEPSPGYSYILSSQINDADKTVEYIIERPNLNRQVYFTLPIDKAIGWNRVLQELGTVDRQGNASPMRASLLSNLREEPEKASNESKGPLKTLSSLWNRPLKPQELAVEMSEGKTADTSPRGAFRIGDTGVSVIETLSQDGKTLNYHTILKDGTTAQIFSSPAGKPVPEKAFSDESTSLAKKNLDWITRQQQALPGGSLQAYSSQPVKPDAAESGYPGSIGLGVHAFSPEDTEHLAEALTKDNIANFATGALFVPVKDAFHIVNHTSAELFTAPTGGSINPALRQLSLSGQAREEVKQQKIDNLDEIFEIGSGFFYSELGVDPNSEAYRAGDVTGRVSLIVFGLVSGGLSLANALKAKIWAHPGYQNLALLKKIDDTPIDEVLSAVQTSDNVAEWPVAVRSRVANRLNQAVKDPNHAREAQASLQKLIQTADDRILPPGDVDSPIQRSIQQAPNDVHPDAPLKPGQTGQHSLVLL